MERVCIGSYDLHRDCDEIITHSPVKKVLIDREKVKRTKSRKRKSERNKRYDQRQECSRQQIVSSPRSRSFRHEKKINAENTPTKFIPSTTVLNSDDSTKEDRDECQDDERNSPKNETFHESLRDAPQSIYSHVSESRVSVGNIVSFDRDEFEDFLWEERRRGNSAAASYMLRNDSDQETEMYGHFCNNIQGLEFLEALDLEDISVENTIFTELYDSPREFDPEDMSIQKKIITNHDDSAKRTNKGQAHTAQSSRLQTESKSRIDVEPATSETMRKNGSKHVGFIDDSKHKTRRLGKQGPFVNFLSFRKKGKLVTKPQKRFMTMFQKRKKNQTADEIREDVRGAEGDANLNSLLEAMASLKVSLERYDKKNKPRFDEDIDLFAVANGAMYDENETADGSMLDTSATSPLSCVSDEIVDRLQSGLLFLQSSIGQCSEILSCNCICADHLLDM